MQNAFVKKKNAFTTKLSNNIVINKSQTLKSVSVFVIYSVPLLPPGGQ
jgi:hypothetical protein